MKYAIINVVNGNYSVYAEGITDLARAKTQFHGRCQVLWNAQDVISATVMIVNEQMNAVDGYKEFIHHDAPAVTPEQEQEPEAE